MKLNLLLTWLAMALLGSVPVSARGQEAAPGTNGLTLLLAKLRVDLQAGKHTEAELADDLNQFDVLLAAENGRKTELAANIILSKGMLYSEVFDDPVQAKVYILEVQKNYPNTIIAGKLEPVLALMDQQAASKKSRVPLLAGTSFPNFFVTDLAGQPLSPALFKGKVVLIDFWASWSSLCQVRLPEVVAVYAKYHDQGFEIIGISLDDDRNQLQDFTRRNQMPWPEYFDGLRLYNKLAVRYGIEAIPATILIDTNGSIIARDLSGEELPKAVAKALGK